MDALPIDQQATLRRIRGIAFVFWGLLIILIDIRIDSLDIVPDFVGALLVAFGIFRLAKLPVSRRYRFVMAVLRILAVVYALASLRQQFPSLITVRGPAGFWLTLQILGILAVPAFLLAMQWLSQAFHLGKALRSWVWTLRFGLAIYGAPLVAGAVFIGAVFVLVKHQWNYHYNFPALAIPAIVVFSIPIVHLFLSMRRTLKEARTVLADQGS